MSVEDDLPASLPERVAVLENLMTARATGDMNTSTYVYEYLRHELMSVPTIKELLPRLCGVVERSMYFGLTSRSNRAATQVGAN